MKHDRDIKRKEEEFSATLLSIEHSHLQEMSALQNDLSRRVEEHQRAMDQLQDSRERLVYTVLGAKQLTSADAFSFWKSAHILKLRGKLEVNTLELKKTIEGLDVLVKEWMTKYKKSRLVAGAKQLVRVWRLLTSGRLRAALFKWMRMCFEAKNEEERNKVRSLRHSYDKLEMSFASELLSLEMRSKQELMDQHEKSNAEIGLLARRLEEEQALAVERGGSLDKINEALSAKIEFMSKELDERNLMVSSSLLKMEVAERETSALKLELAIAMSAKAKEENNNISVNNVCTATQTSTDVRTTESNRLVEQLSTEVEVLKRSLAEVTDQLAEVVATEEDYRLKREQSPNRLRKSLETNKETIVVAESSTMAEELTRVYKELNVSHYNPQASYSLVFNALYARRRYFGESWRSVSTHFATQLEGKP